MARLAQDGILVKLPNVGSTVASPSRKQTRDILAARKMVEPAIVRLLAAEPSTSGHRYMGLSQISGFNGKLTVGREIPAPDVVERTDDSECDYRKAEAAVEG